MEKIKKFIKTKEGKEVCFRIFVRKKDEELGDYIHSKKLILSAFNAYKAMLVFLDKYKEANPEEDFGEIVSRMALNYDDDTHYAECWELWEKVVCDFMDEDPTEGEWR